MCTKIAWCTFIIFQSYACSLRNSQLPPIHLFWMVSLKLSQWKSQIYACSGAKVIKSTMELYNVHYYNLVLELRENLHGIRSPLQSYLNKLELRCSWFLFFLLLILLFLFISFLIYKIPLNYLFGFHRARHFMAAFYIP